MHNINEGNSTRNDQASDISKFSSRKKMLKKKKPFVHDDNIFKSQIK
jgi:hypothetical protein